MFFSVINSVNQYKDLKQYAIDGLQQAISNFYFLFQPSLTSPIYQFMSHPQPLRANHPSPHQYQPNRQLSGIPLKFKAMILKSIYDKHRGKQLSCKRDAFHLWYIQKNDNQLIKDCMDRVLIAQNQSKFTASRFFYRMKFLVRKQLCQANHQSQDSNSQIANSNQQKQESSNSQIQQAQNSAKKNFTDYFQSLKNIFSMKLIQCENQLLSGSLINDKDDKNNSKHHRFKTEGCEVGTSVDESFQAMCRLSVFRQEKILELEKKQTEIQKKFTEVEAKECQIDRMLVDKVNTVKELGKKVGVTLFRSFLANKQRQLIHYSLNLLAKHCHQSKLLEQSQLTKLHHLQLINKQSSQIHIQIQQTNAFTTSHSFLSTQRSSQCSLPPLKQIDTQISHVEYSISLLNQTIKKDSDLQELYRQFQAQFGEFQAIEKDFQLLRVKTRNSLFDRLINIKKKLQLWLLQQAFKSIKQSIRSKTPSHNKQNLSRSRVNLGTLHQIFSKRLIPVQNQQNDKQDYRSQVQRSMTSIKMICQRDNNTDSKFYQPQIKGAIKKQTLKFDASSISNEMSSEMNTTLGQGFFKEKPTAVSEKPSSTNSNSPSKTHVNFVLPQSDLTSKWSIKPKNSEVSLQKSQGLLQSMNDGFRKKQQHKMNNTGFYELSMKSFDDSEASSSPSNQYHAQLKSQYWWNDLEEKDNLVFRDGEKTSKNIRESGGDDEQGV